MDPKKEIQEELSAISPLLANLPKKEAFDVPSSGAATNHAFETILNVNKNIVQPSIPSNYFESLPNKIINTIKEDESSATLPSSHPYQVDSHYFEQLPARIQSRLHKGMLVSMQKYRWGLAVAACAIGLLGLMIFDFNGNQNNEPQTNVQPALAMNDARLNEALNQIETADLEEYLVEEGHDVDAAVMASLEDDVNAPNETELLTDNDKLNHVMMEATKKADGNINTYELF